MAATFTPTFCGQVAVRRASDPVEIVEALAATAMRDRFLALAADYERDAIGADRDGRCDGHVYRALASELLTQAADLQVALNALADGRRVAA